MASDFNYRQNMWRTVSLCFLFSSFLYDRSVYLVFASLTFLSSSYSRAFAEATAVEKALSIPFSKVSIGFNMERNLKRNPSLMTPQINNRTLENAMGMNDCPHTLAMKISQQQTRDSLVLKATGVQIVDDINVMEEMAESNSIEEEDHLPSDMKFVEEDAFDAGLKVLEVFILSCFFTVSHFCMQLFQASELKSHPDMFFHDQVTWLQYRESASELKDDMQDTTGGIEEVYLF